MIEPMYRDEALHHRYSAVQGDVLHLAPAWTRWVFWELLAAVLALTAYLLFGTLNEYATGPAVVWMDGQTIVAAPVSGTVSEILVKTGQQVEKGDVLVRLSSAVEQADLDRLTSDFEFRLGKLLRDPSDQQAKTALSEIATQKQVAAATLERFTIRAPESAVVGDIRIRRGVRLEAGGIVLSLAVESHSCAVRVMLPAQYKPQLHTGIAMRFELTGYRYAYQEMTVRSVSAQIAGPDEVRRLLGQEIGDTVQLTGPMVLVEATPREPTFIVDGRRYDFYHGMSGIGEVRVRTENVLVSLVPALRILSGARNANQ